MSIGGAATGASMGSSFGPWGVGIGAGLGALGLFDSDEDPMATQLEYAKQQFEALGNPPDLSYELALKQFREAGQLSPEQEEAYRLNYSNIAGIQEDTTGRDTQLEALNLLKQRGRGLGTEERAAFNEMRDQAQRDAEAKRAQIMNQMAARGQGGSGAELLSALQGAQSANTELSKQGDRMAATAAQNALGAISQAGQLGSSLRSQDYGAQMDKARALDALAQFNTQNAQNVHQRNISAMNQAQAANLQNKQNISNMNVQQANTETQRQAQAQRDYWNDQYKIAAGKAGMATNSASMYAANQKPNEWQQLGTALNTFGQAYKKDTGNNLGQGISNWFGSFGSSKTKKPYDEGDYHP